MIDWERVESLRAEIGADDFGEVVTLFLEEVDEVVSRLQATPDPATYEDDLHFLKGSALNLGFSALSDLCHHGERRAASGQADRVDVGAVIRLYQESRGTFLARIDRGNRRATG